MSDVNQLQSRHIDLCGRWQATDVEGGTLADINLPGDILSGLAAAEHVPDPYIGQNEYACRWVADQTWNLVRTVELSAEQLQSGLIWYLDLTYLDTVVTISINGAVVAQTNNCFRRYRPDVTAHLIAGLNTIELLFHANPKEAVNRAGDQPFPIPYSTDNCPIPFVNMLRKPQCHFGWDWNIAVAPLGIYGELSLRAMATHRLEHLEVSQTMDRSGAVDLNVTVSVYAEGHHQVELQVSVEGKLHVAQLSLEPGDNRASLTCRIDQPEQWWPIGMGGQKLYEVCAEIGSERLVHRIGIREFALSTRGDDAGSEFALLVNGERVFCRGANWIPADALPSNMSEKRVRCLLESAVAANMNMIRVWGGGFYEADWFYDLCDELGLLVWQDFMFSCSLYPSTNEFMAEVEAEVDYQVRRLNSHACLALWCGDNELIGALGWFDESKADRDRYLVNYDRLNRTVEHGLRTIAPTALWWPSSPSPGPLNFGDAWHEDGAGDMHCWDVWHEGESFEHYRTKRPRFCSEFGFQSFPTMNDVRKFSRLEDQNISSAVMESHQKNAGGNARITETIFRYFKFPKDFEQFVYLSQIQQGLAMRTAVDYWRAQKPHTMGTLYWQLNDTWPCASWSSISHSGEWKALHYMARRFYQPLQVVAYPDGNDLVLTAINDTRATRSIAGTVQLHAPSGEELGELSFNGEVPTDRAVDIFRRPLIEMPGAELVRFAWRADDATTGNDHFCLTRYKQLALPPANLETRISSTSVSLEIAVSAEKLALFVVLTSAVAGQFSEGCFDIGPGETQHISFTPADPDLIQQAAKTISVCDLVSSFSVH